MLNVVHTFHMFGRTPRSEQSLDKPLSPRLPVGVTGNTAVFGIADIGSNPMRGTNLTLSVQSITAQT